jgi:hypothetical protein
MVSPWASNENKSCMRVEKREFPWEFSQLSLLDQTRTRVAWELRSESFHESFLNFHCLIKREQELHECWLARVYVRVFSTFVAYVIKREQELHESWQARVYMRVFSTFIAWSNENKSCMRVIRANSIIANKQNSHQLSSKVEPAQTYWRRQQPKETLRQWHCCWLEIVVRMGKIPRKFAKILV